MARPVRAKGQARVSGQGQAVRSADEARRLAQPYTRGISSLASSTMAAARAADPTRHQLQKSERVVERAGWGRAGLGLGPGSGLGLT